jgi:antitoxin StbD
MTALLNRAEQAVSATAMVRGFSARLKDVTSGDISHLVIFKDNEPAAVLVGIDAYQSLQDELEDLRSELLAIERLPSLDTDVTVSLEEMEARFK